MSNVDPTLPDTPPQTVDVEAELAAALIRIEDLEGRLAMVERSLNEQVMEELTTEDLAAVEEDEAALLVVEDLVEP